MAKTLKDIRYLILPELYEVLSTLEGGEATDISALKTAVGDADSGLVKDVADLETAVGDAEAGLVKDVADIEAAIGDESTEGTILARIKALEDAG